MLSLRYFNNNYIISPSSKLEEDEFKEYVIMFKSIRLYYSKGYYGWTLSFSQVGEVLKWLKKWKVEIEFLPSAEKKYIEEYNSFYKKELVCFRNRNEINFQNVVNPNYTLKEFQKKSLNEMAKRNVSFLWDEAGLGKNLQSSVMAHYWFDRKMIDGLIIIVRNSLTYTWYDDFLKYGNIIKPEEVEIIDVNNRKNCFYKYRNKKVLIMGNHIFNTLIKSHTSKEILNIKEAWNKTSLGLIIDEGQDFRNADSKKTSSLIKHSNQFDFKIDSTASPWNKFWQIYGQASIIDRSILPMSQNEFKMYIAEDLGSPYDPYHINEYNPSKVMEIQDKLFPYVIRRLKKDVPEMKYKQSSEHLKFLMSKNHFELYNEMKDREFLSVKKSHKGVISINNLEKFFPYTMQVIDNPFLLKGKINDENINKMLEKWSFDKDKRVEYLDEIIEDIVVERNDKLIVFDTHPLTLDMLGERYKKYNPVVIHGKIKNKNKEEFRENERKRFNNDDSTKLAFLSAETSSAGGNWNTKCNTIITFTQPSDSIQYYQLGERVNRLDSTRDSLFINLSFINTFDMIRYYRNVNKVEFNEKFGSLNEEEINKLLNGII
jgi:hypothetical protein